MFLKRLWDTENKKTVRATGPSGKKCQMFTNDDGSKLYIYDASQWLVCNPQPTGYEYGPSDWQQLDDQEVGYYETNKPTELFSRDQGDEVTYTFKDYNGTVLKTGKVDEGTAPTPPADPTREATAQYTYTFAGWNPTVGKIYKKTTYTATYTATVNKYDITFVDEDWTTELDSQELDYWATPVYAWETPTKTGYTFTGWTPAIATVTADATYTATYEPNEYTVSIASNDETYGTVDVASVTADYGTTISASDNVLTIGETEVTATAETGYTFSSWWTLPETVTEDLSITATFTEE